MKRYFRSIADLENRPEFQEFLQREFPQAASEFPEGVSRRRWLQLMGASLSFGAASGCRYYKEEFAAFTAAPEGRIPGVPTYFATNFEWAGRIVHALVTSLDGRPIQLRGNPDHPSLDVSAASEFQDGKEKQFKQVGLDAISQASILSLYDPDRLGEAVAHRADVDTASKAFLNGEGTDSNSYNPMVAIVRNSGTKMDPDTVQELISKASQEIASSLGSGTAVIYESTSSPSMLRLLAQFHEKYPDALLVKYEPFDGSPVRDALKSLGAPTAKLSYRLDAAKVIVALDADLLGTDPMAARYAHQFAAGRTPDTTGSMNRLYAIESLYSVTGSAADFRLPVRSSDIGSVLARIEAAVDARMAGDRAAPIDAATPFSELSFEDRVERT
ncbi:MAG: TAT-variant-translocated molybdopterin oxidoreductase, partial [Pirellulaceae bacterium]